MVPGDAFYLNVVDSHRYFVLCSSVNPSHKVLVFNFTTHRPGHCDETCIVLPSEYGGIAHNSVVMFSRGLLLEEPALSNFKSCIGAPLPSIGNDTLLRIKAGALASIHTPKKIKKFLSHL